MSVTCLRLKISLKNKPFKNFLFSDEKMSLDLINLTSIFKILQQFQTKKLFFTIVLKYKKKNVLRSSI